MNRYLKPSCLPFMTLAAGILGLALRLWLMATGVDAKGLLVTTHPAHILVFVLTALVMGFLALAVRPLDALKHYTDLFPRKPLAGLGCIAAAVGILLVCLQDRNKRADMVTNVSLILGVLAAICLVLIAICRFNGRRPFFGLHCIVTLFMMVHLVSQYRLFSSEPQLQVYFFPLLASIFLILSAYHKTIFAAKHTNTRLLAFFSQGALFFCCLSLNTTQWYMYFGMMLWAVVQIYPCILTKKES